MICERCNKPATVHFTEISKGKATEVHLCEACAQEAGYIQQQHVPINQLLNQFLQASAQIGDKETLRCPDCGLTWQEFKESGLLGCSRDYQVFESHLQGVIERAQQGANHHTGKLLAAKPKGQDPVKLRQAELVKLRKELARAVEDEQYEAAARIRDKIKTVETKKE